MLLVLIIYRLYYWREWVVMILGIIAPFFALFTYYFLTDGVQAAFYNVSSNALSINIAVNMLNTGEILISLMLVLFMLVSFFITLGQLSDSVIIFRKKTTIVMLLFLLGIVFSLYEILFPLNIQNYVIPMAFTLTTLFLSQRKAKVSNTFFIIFLLTAFASVYLVS